MLTSDVINQIFGIKEAYELPNVLSSIMHDEQRREEIFRQFLELEQDLSYDWFTDYFQTEHGDRAKLKQDYTPQGICEILKGLKPNGARTIADICAGTGGLSISQWSKDEEATFYMEELSTRAFPLLLFNMAIRNIDATILQVDSLTNDFTQGYRLTKKENGFSRIERIKTDYEQKEQGQEQEEEKFDYIIMNPPYSLNWQNKEFAEDKRFQEYGLPPTSKADFGFILHALHMLQEQGTLAAILPHGILFRGQQEGKIRQKLIENNLIDAIIGLPDKLFLNTGIPVCIIVLKKNKESKDILFIDASKEYKKGSKQNTMEQEHIAKILSAYHDRKDIDKFAHVARMQELEENEYNLNIPRYVDTFEPEEVP